MNNPPRNTPRDEPTPHESSDRPAPWVLDLGLEVASGRRPWLQPLAGAALLFGTPFLIKMIGGADLAAAENAPELAAFIDGLNVDEQCELVALAWIGRGSFTKEEWREALAEARHAHNTRTAEYLMGLPLLGDYLADGLAEFGHTCDE